MSGFAEVLPVLIGLSPIEDVAAEGFCGEMEGF